MLALPTITLSENQPQDVSLPIGITAIQIHNASVGFLTVNISGNSTYVGPQSWVTIPLGGQTTSMTLELLDAPVGTVYATVFMATDGNLPNTLVSGSLNQQQVTVESGTVAISGTPTVDFASDATVSITGTPTVDLASGASVEISGTPTIDLASGASVAISGTPTVEFASGSTVSISGTPTVDLASGASVTISGTPTINLAPDASVAISGTPTIVIQSGSVNINGGQLTNSSGVALQPTSDQLVISDLGDGSAGAVSFGADTLLTSDLQATSITVPSGIEVGTGGYRIRCQGTCEVNGIVENWAINSTDEEVGAPGATGTLAGGAAGVSTNGSVIPGGVPASATLEGGSGGYGDGEYGGITPTSIASPTISLLHTGTLSGGASGGAGASTGVSSNSGSGGGVVLILCAEITGSGEIYAIGGNGYTTYTHGGGAGGGGGGVVIVACYTNSFTGSLYAYGGVGDGASFTTNGGNGTTMIIITS